MTNPYGLDTLGLWDATAGLPEQLSRAMEESAHVLRGFTLPGGDLRAAVVLGMGSSGLAGDVATHDDRATAPILVVKGFGIPDFVGPDTLVVAVSWSGDTEETCSATSAAREKGAPVVVVSGGGALSELARTADLPLLSLPPGLPASRTAWGASVVSLLLTLSHLGLLPDTTPSLAAAVSVLRRRRDALVAAHSAAEEVARRIGRTMPLVYGTSGLNAVAARRWKTQINENAKTPSFVAVQPDLAHNEVAGWGQHGDVTRQVLSLVTLRHDGEHPGVARRVDRVIGAVDEVMADVIEVRAQGDDDLARMFDLALFGDFVSLHLAGREGTDPGPVPAVQEARRARQA